ncbi:MAG: bifunctional aldolase/short-chain dehydrogenase [Acidobacteriota bacterium]|nr:bifunctional aldolase/short-chain dehydrogenase [Acidobacteriota bacterium]
MSNWSDTDAASYVKTYAEYGEDPALRVYTSRLLGRDPSLVLHGGGNTSVKTTMTDELGRKVQVLCVKGSGWDLADIEPAGLPACYLEPLQAYRALDALSDEDMVNGVRRALLSTASPNPSVETLLHAFLPHKFIDHTHADAVLALANQPNAEELCRKIYGDRMGIVPYIMPGFLLAKKAVEVYEADPDVEGLILVNHGIFSFGDTARESYERMIEMVDLAKKHIAEHGSISFEPISHTPLDGNFAPFLSVLRGRLENHPEGIGGVVLQARTSAQVETFLARSDLAEVTARGPVTPDHVIRTKQKPLVIADARLDDPNAFAAQVDILLAEYVTDYHDYFRTQVEAKNTARKELHPLPPVFLIPGIGLVTAGKTAKAANIAADIYLHTIDTIIKAEMVGSHQPLSRDHLFDMEYWSLEQAKLGKKKPKPMEGKVTLVSGAAGGIGRAVAESFARAGSNLVLTDLDPAALSELAGALKTRHGVAVATHMCDLTDHYSVQALVDAAANSFGGLDVVVSNAGVAPVGPIAEAHETLEASLKINLMAHQYLASASCKLMVRQGTGGCLLFNASKSAFNPGPGFGAYSIPKAALIALMKQYAVEFAPMGIRSMAVNADRIRTPLLDMEAVAQRAASRGLELDEYFRSNLLGREVLPEDVADAFYHLYLSEKSTGTLLTVDGGNIAASPR